MQCHICTAVVNHYDSVYFPDRLCAEQNFPCFLLCFSCSDALALYFFKKDMLARREIGVPSQFKKRPSLLKKA
jgi:hypothetical protein